MLAKELLPVHLVGLQSSMGDWARRAHEVVWIDESEKVLRYWRDTGQTTDQSAEMGLWHIGRADCGGSEIIWDYEGKTELKGWMGSHGDIEWELEDLFEEAQAMEEQGLEVVLSTVLFGCINEN